MAIQKFLLNQCAGLPRCARNDGHIELISVSIEHSTEQTKGYKGRIVMLGDKFRKELSVYASITIKTYDPSRLFFYSQRGRDGF